MNWRRSVRKIRFAFYWPGLFLYFSGSHRSRVLVVCDDELLLIKDRTTYFYDERTWNLPGGGMRHGEEDAVAAVRELHEELGLELDSSQFRTIGQQLSGSYGLRYQAHFFVVKLSQKPALTIDNHEVRSAQWFRLDQVNQLPQKVEVTQGLGLLADQQ